MEYENTDEDPSTGNTRVVTITSMTDDGGTANGGDNDAVLSLASTVTVAATDNDNPVNTVSAQSANEDVATDFTGTSIADPDDTSLDSVQITVTLGTFTLATSQASYAVGSQGTPASTVTIGGTIANINVALATITWTSASNDNTNAVFTILSDDGPNTDSDDFTVTVTAINDEPSIACTGDSPTYAEDASAEGLFNTCTVLAGGDSGDAESDAIATMVFTVTNVQDTSEIISFDGTSITLAAGQGASTAGTQSGGGVTYAVTGCSNTCTVTITATTGSMTLAELDAAVEAMTYSNSDQSPTIADTRVVTITTLTDEGSSSSPHDNSAAEADASTVTLTKSNDLPTTGDQTKTILEDATYTAASGDFTFADVDGDSITQIKVTTLELAGTLYYDADGNDAYTSSEDVTLNQVITIGNIANLQFTPAANANGATYATFQFMVHDGTGYSGAGIITMAVTAVNDAPAVSGGNTGTATESTDNTDDTETGTLTSTDDEGNTRTWCIQSVSVVGSTCTSTGTYGTLVVTVATGAWVYTLDQDDAQTDALDGGESVDETFTVVVTDDGGTDNNGDDDATGVLTVTIAGADDAPTTSTPDTQAGTEDTLFTGYVVADFPFTDVDGDDNALVSITITVVESTGDLEKSTNGADWTDVAANDVILSAHIQHLRLDPADDSITSVTFTYTVQDGTQSSNTGIMTTSFANVNDAPDASSATGTLAAVA
jgi:VCBS repeat-containing protein